MAGALEGKGGDGQDEATHKRKSADEGGGTPKRRGPAGSDSSGGRSRAETGFYTTSPPPWLPSCRRGRNFRRWTTP
eukprot:10026369-Alexandrium_andersonii.AAC.1